MLPIVQYPFYSTSIKLVQNPGVGPSNVSDLATQDHTSRPTVVMQSFLPP